MGSGRISVIVKRVLALGVVLALLPWVGIARADVSLDEQLIEAAKKGDLELLNSLLEKGADVNSKDRDGLTVLMNASEAGRLESVKLLLDKGADVGAQTKNGSTALRKAVDNQYPGVVKLLLDRGADVNGKLNDGSFILMWAAITGNADVVYELVQKGLILMPWIAMAPLLLHGLPLWSTRIW